MQHQGRWSVAGITFLGICTAISGCQTSALSSLVTEAPRFKATAAASPAPQTPTSILAPRTSVVWSVRSADAQPVAKMRGEDTVGPNGSIELGPYGSVNVAGLSIAQARLLMEQHLVKYLKDPKVTLDIRAATNPVVHDSTPAITVGQVVPVAAEESAAHAAAAASAANEHSLPVAEPSPLAGTPVSRQRGEPVP